MGRRFFNRLEPTSPDFFESMAIVTICRLRTHPEAAIYILCRSNFVYSKDFANFVAVSKT